MSRQEILQRKDHEPRGHNIHERGGLDPKIWQRIASVQELPQNLQRYAEAASSIPQRIQDEGFTSRIFLSRNDWLTVFHIIGGEKALKGKMKPGSDADIALYAAIEATHSYTLGDFISDRLQTQGLIWNGGSWEEKKTTKTRTITQKSLAYDEDTVKIKIQTDSIDDATAIFPTVPLEPNESYIDKKLRDALLFEPRKAKERTIIQLPPDQMFAHLTNELSGLPEDKLLAMLYKKGFPGRMPELFIPYPKRGNKNKRTKYIDEAKEMHYVVPVVSIPQKNGLLIVQSAWRNSDDDMSGRKAEILLTGSIPLQ